MGQSFWPFRFEQQTPYLLAHEVYQQLGYKLLSGLYRRLRSTPCPDKPRRQVTRDRFLWEIPVSAVPLLLSRKLSGTQATLLRARFSTAVHTAMQVQQTTQSEYVSVSEDGQHVVECCPIRGQRELPFGNRSDLSQSSQSLLVALLNLERIEPSVQNQLQRLLDTLVKPVLVPLVQVAVKAEFDRQRGASKIAVAPPRRLTTGEVLHLLLERCGNDKHGVPCRGRFGTGVYAYRALTSPRLFLLARRAGLHLNRSKIQDDSFEERYEYWWTPESVDRVAPHVTAWFHLRTPTMRQVSKVPLVYDWDVEDVVNRLKTIPGANSDKIARFLAITERYAPCAAYPVRTHTGA